MGVPAGSLAGKTDLTNDGALGTGHFDWSALLTTAPELGVKYYFIEDESPSAKASRTEGDGVLFFGLGACAGLRRVRLPEDEQEPIVGRVRTFTQHRKTGLTHLLLDRLRRNHPPVAGLAVGNRAGCLPIQDVHASGIREPLAEVCKQCWAVEQQVIRVQEENRVDRLGAQVGIALLGQHGRQRDAGRRRRPLVPLSRPFLQDDVHGIARSRLENRTDQITPLAQGDKRDASVGIPWRRQ